MKCTDRSVWPGLLAMWILSGICMTTGVASASSESSTEPSEEVKHLIVMVGGQESGADTLGAGIIVGVRADRLYIITANHVVRRAGQNLHVKLRSLPGERVPAKLLEDRDPQLDLAVLSVMAVKRHAIPVDEVPFDRLGDANAMKRGDAVYHVGHPNGIPWRVNVTPDRVSDRAGDLIKFESNSIAPGDSGGGLFNGRWELVGMIKADQPPDGIAVSIGRILGRLKQWGYPVNLTRRKKPEEQVAQPSQERPDDRERQLESQIAEERRKLAELRQRVEEERRKLLESKRREPQLPVRQPLSYRGFDAIGRYPTVVQVFDPG